MNSYVSREELLFVCTKSPQFKNGSSNSKLALTFPKINYYSFIIFIIDLKLHEMQKSLITFYFNSINN